MYSMTWHSMVKVFAVNHRSDVQLRLIEGTSKPFSAWLRERCSVVYDTLSPAVLGDAF